MRRALIISYYWPPSGGSGVQRWVKFSKYLPSQGWQPVVYTPENPELIAVDDSLGNEIPPEVEVIRRHIFEPYEMYRRLSGKKRTTPQQGEVNPINAGHKGAGGRISMFIRGNFFIPDPRCMWVRPSVRFLKKYLKDHPVDIIISTGPPHSMHLIARKIAIATGIPWIADFRDPWTRMFYFKHLSLTSLSRKIHARLEKQVLDDASAIVAVSPLVQEEFRQMTSTRVELITNGFDADDLSAAGSISVQEESCAAGTPDSNFFNITHTGLFASDGNPEVLWEVLREKSSADEMFRKCLRIRLAGKTDNEIIASVTAAGLGANLVNLGYCRHIQAVREQRNASIELLPLRKEPEYKAVLPGKLFEYLASGHPILGIGQTDGAMASIIHDTQTGEVFDWNDKEAMHGFIDRQWQEFLLHGRTSTDPERIAPYERRATTACMAALMNELTSVIRRN